MQQAHRVICVLANWQPVSAVDEDEWFVLLWWRPWNGCLYVFSHLHRETLYTILRLRRLETLCLSL